MKKWLILLLLLIAVPVSAQNVTVTGTITDTQSTPYSNGSLTVSLVNTTGQVATFGGSPTFQKVYSATLSSTGAFSISLPPNSTASPSILPIGTQWNFSYQAQGGYGAANVSVTITGAGDISGTISNQTRITWPYGNIPPPGGFGQVIIFVSPTTLGWGNNGGCGIVTTKTTNYSASGTDAGRTLSFNGTNLTLTLPNPLPNPAWSICVNDLAATNLTISPNGLTLNGGGSLSISTGQGVSISTDGTNYYYVGGVSSSSGTVTPEPQYSIPYYSASGTASTLGQVCSPPTANGSYNLLYSVTASAAVQPSCPEVGMTSAVISGASNSYTVAYSDVSGQNVQHDLAGSQAVTVTLPTPTTLTNTNAVFRYTNNSAQSDTITPTTWTISKNGAAAGASISVAANTTCLVYVDAFNASVWDANCLSSTASGAPTFPVNAQTASYSVVAGDFSSCKLITMSSTAATTVTLLGVAPAAGRCIQVQNINTGAVTIARNGLNIDGSAQNIILGAYNGTFVISDGSNYFTQHGLPIGCLSSCSWFPMFNAPVTGGVAQGVSNANNPILFRTRIEQVETATKITFNVATLAAASHGDLGLYGNCTTTCSKLWDTGSFSVASTGVQTVTITAVTIPPGTYYVGFCSDSSTDQVSAVSVSSNFIANATAPANTWGISSDSCAAGVLPSTITIANITNNVNVNPPFMMVSN